MKINKDFLFIFTPFYISNADFYIVLTHIKIICNSFLFFLFYSLEHIFLLVFHLLLFGYFLLGSHILHPSNFCNLDFSILKPYLITIKIAYFLVFIDLLFFLLHP
jgi:hypothetical protein